ncbi:alpha/beta hydrolase [Pararhodobacter sp.]|uniref:alpha/beta hydrolase n=1 Tax=Pararhodobacter sp. TaxID=2127056 RepID=UPI002B00383B|nr:alpha/beta hydrolase [Pararhodobacter sp.]
MTKHDPKDYSWLPADVLAFIAKTDAAYPPDAVNFTIAEQRAFYDKMCAAFAPPHPEGLRAQDLSLNGVPCRRYTPTAPREGVTVLYFHGGGFVVGGLHSHDSICAELAEGAQATLISVDYRLVPEHKHPAAYDDCIAVAEAVAGPKILVGDSAGANLAASVAATRDDIVGQVLIYGGFGRDLSLPSFTRHAFAPGLTLADIEFYADLRYAKGRPEHDVTSVPMDAEDFSVYPPTALFSAECDPLASESVEFAARLAEAGVPVTFTEEPGLIHGYLRARTMADGARRSFENITTALRDMVTKASDQ